MITKSLRGASSDNFCLINHLANNRHIPANKSENIEEFIHPASSKPDPDPVLISAYVPDTLPDTDCLCSFHAYTYA